MSSPCPDPPLSKYTLWVPGSEPPRALHDLVCHYQIPVNSALLRGWRLLALDALSAVDALVDFLPYLRYF